MTLMEEAILGILGSCPSSLAAISLSRLTAAVCKHTQRETQMQTQTISENTVLNDGIAPHPAKYLFYDLKETEQKGK